MAQTNEELLGYLHDLVVKSQGLGIPWVKVNPTTFAAHIPGANARMTIQRVLRPPQHMIVQRNLGGVIRNVPVPSSAPPTINYVFQVLDAQTGTPVLNLVSSPEDKASPLLDEMYQAAEIMGAKKGLDILKKIISG